MVETVSLPFGGDAERDVTLEPPKQIGDFNASTDAHDCVKVIRHG